MTPPAKIGALAVTAFVLVVVVLWVRRRMAHEADVARLASYVERARAMDEARIEWMRTLATEPPAGGDYGACPIAAMEKARVARLASPDAKGAFLTDAFSAIAAGREPLPLTEWTYELDVITSHERAVLYDYATDRALCAGSVRGLAEGDDPRGRLVGL